MLNRSHTPRRSNKIRRTLLIVVTKIIIFLLGSTVRTQPSKNIGELPLFCRRAHARVPGAAVHARPLQHSELTASGCFCAQILIPRTAAFMSPLQHMDVTRYSGKLACEFRSVLPTRRGCRCVHPIAAACACPLQQFQVTFGSVGTNSTEQDAAVGGAFEHFEVTPKGGRFASVRTQWAAVVMCILKQCEIAL